VELKWTELAVGDLDQIESYVYLEGSPAVVVALVLKVIDIAEKVLLQHSSAGRSGRVKGTRELVISGTPFAIIYRVVLGPDQVQVLRVLHSAREWPVSN
jgi:toxin ParE1/3/4